MRLSVLLDYYRGTRFDKQDIENSQTLLNYIKRANLLNHQIKLGLLRHPRLPNIFNLLTEGGGREIFNVHHMKWYVFDNKIIFTG
jgi:CDP-diacylglycerol--glycerol-3-phosphate 3-phosphatidyltransferase